MTDPHVLTLAPRTVGLARLLVGTAVIAVLLYTYWLGLPAGRVNLFDYFGYFTNLTSLLMSALLIGAGSLTLLRRPAPGWLALARGVGTTCMLLVAVIYNVIVPGTGSAPVWVSIILHVVFPVAVALDWVFVGDRGALSWRRLWTVVAYPIVWIAIVLVRGATDGWVPYGFLLPSRGLPALAATVAGLLTALLAFGSLVWLASRLSLSVRRAWPRSDGDRSPHRRTM